MYGLDFMSTPCIKTKAYLGVVNGHSVDSVVFFVQNLPYFVAVTNTWRSVFFWETLSNSLYYIVSAM